MKAKRRILIAGAALALCALAAALIFNTPERRTVRFFERHREILEEDAAAAREGGRAASRLDLTVNLWEGEHPILEYIVVSTGLAPSSRYHGFFYSFDGVPAAFQNADAALRAAADGAWEWRGAGDNHGRVRRLEGNWFYFEASF